jgi:hypothetical protein
MKQIIIKHIVSHGEQLIVVLEDNTVIIAPDMETAISQYQEKLSKEQE